MQDCQNPERPATQLLTLNFEMRARRFIDSNEPDHEDTIFESLFKVCRSLISNSKLKNAEVQETPLTFEMAHENLPMSVYTASYLKQVIRMLQTNKGQLDLSGLKQMVDRMITAESLLVTVNSLPLYLVIQMFFDMELSSTQPDKKTPAVLNEAKNITTATNTPYNQDIVMKPSPSSEGSICYRVWKVLKTELERIK